MSSADPQAAAQPGKPVAALSSSQDESPAAPVNKPTHKGSGKRRRFFFDHFADLQIYSADPVNRHGVALINQMHLTQGARYEAARRLAKKNSISIVSI
ncbi:hypothetical protein, partial [Bradyrhizobium sp. SUTN9-2]|uniref:hypothetical protein n=1 Tax=Bradyrhizobium sp. SUTN9-2 TaxID=1167456 RepID=UPI0019575679